MKKHTSDLYLFLVAVGVLASSVSTFAAGDASQDEHHGHRRPKLTQEQKNCLHEQGLPAPGSGTRPDRSKLEAAFKACNIPAPPHHERRASDERQGGSDEAPSQE